jgi:hypothetical protein
MKEGEGAFLEFTCGLRGHFHSSTAQHTHAGRLPGWFSGTNFNFLRLDGWTDCLEFGVGSPVPRVAVSGRGRQRVPERARGCQRVPEGAKGCQRVPEGARGCQRRVPEGASRGCQRVPEGASGCQRVPAEGARGCQRVPEGARGCQRVPEGARGCQRVPEGARGCQRVPAEGASGGCQRRVPEGARGCQRVPDARGRVPLGWLEILQYTEISMMYVLLTTFILFESTHVHPSGTLSCFLAVTVVSMLASLVEANQPTTTLSPFALFIT